MRPHDTQAAVEDLDDTDTQLFDVSVKCGTAKSTQSGIDLYTALGMVTVEGGVWMTNLSGDEVTITIKPVA